jgi:hypothetical protein
MAWRYLTESLTSPRSDWRLLARRLKRLIAREENVNTLPNRELIRSLDLALVPSKAKPGTITAMIDDLVQAGADEWYLDARAMKLVLRGFDAVPALIEHLDDDRLTHGMSGILRGPLRHDRVRDFVSDVLAKIAGGALGGSETEGPDPPVTKAQALDCGKKARQTGEEAYLLAGVLRGAEIVGEPDRYLLEIIAKKYPQSLPALYLKVVDKQQGVESTDMAAAIGASALAREKKLELLLHAVRGSNARHRVSALWALKDVDTRLFAQLLVQLLESLPQKAKGPDSDRPEASYALLVSETADPRAWEALLKVAKRSSAGLRLEILERVGARPSDNKQRRPRLRFLVGLLDDPAVRELTFDPRSRGRGPAAQDFERLAVRDLAAMEIASILELRAEPKPNWTAEQWTKLRTDVRRALERRAKSGAGK